MRSKFAKFEQNVTLCLLALPTLGVCGLENFVTPRAACVDGSMHNNVRLSRVSLAKQKFAANCSS